MQSPLELIACVHKASSLHICVSSRPICEDGDEIPNMDQSKGVVAAGTAI
jgi:hypothetical protein